MGDYSERYLKKENESIIQIYNKMIDKKMDFSNKSLNCVIQKNIESYESLIEQKKEALTQTSNHLIDVLAHNNDEEFEGATPPKTFLEKQNEEINKFKEEIRTLTELHNASMDKSLEVVPERVLKNL